MITGPAPSVITSIWPSAVRRSSRVRWSSADAAWVMSVSHSAMEGSEQIRMINVSAGANGGLLRSRRQRWRHPVRQRDVVAVQRHCHHGVIADQRGQLDHADRLPAVEHAPVILLADGLAAIELLGVIEDGEAVGIERGGPAAGVNVVDHRLRQTGL